MNKNVNKNEEWLNDYNDFLSCECQPPQGTSDQVLRNIGKLIKPSPYSVFSKVLGIHAVIGVLSLSICHQFGLNPFNTNSSLADWFMTAGGHHVCMILCGVISIALSILAAGLFLTIEEVRAFRKTEVLQFLTLGILTLGAFVLFGAEVTIGLGGLWFLGLLLGGFATTEIVLKLKVA